MAKIKRLPEHLANQIAAGEVVERPASIVKELIENSIDAQARRVKIEVTQGGIARIRVSDDGDGMDSADAALALERHATSKIATVEDLQRIATFGFRGEALPSIASVARFKLISRAKGAPEGVEVSKEGGAPTEVRPSGCAEGTSIEVSDLFFNVPARRKFLKSVASEASHVAEVVADAALARPEVTFVLTRDGKTPREYLRVGSRNDRAAQVLPGESLAHCMFSDGGVTVDAYLAAPERARIGALGLHLLVNGRPVRDRQLARAVAQAYGSVLEAGRYPVGVVYIDLPLDGVDVNVHPQKAEVRFANGRELFDAVTRGLRDKVTRKFAVPVRAFDAPHFARRELAEGPSPGTTPHPLGLFSGGAASASASPVAAYVETPRSMPLSPALAESRPAPEGNGVRIAEAPAESSTERPGQLFPRPSGFYANLVFLGQVRATFLVCEGADGIYILDQHAAAERVTFDRLRRAYESREIVTQRLLVPETVALSSSEVATLDGASDALASLGVEVRAISSTAIAVHSLPQMLARKNPERVVRDLLAEVGRDALRPFGDAVDMVLATMACHGSIRAGDPISAAEARALLQSMDGIDWGGHCPHGRPVVTRLSFEELERRVGR